MVWEQKMTSSPLRMPAARGDDQAVGGVADAQGVAGAEEIRQIFLKLREIALENKRATAADVADDREQHVLLVGEQARVVEKWNGEGLGGGHGILPAFIAGAVDGFSLYAIS